MSSYYPQQQPQPHSNYDAYPMYSIHPDGPYADPTTEKYARYNTIPPRSCCDRVCCGCCTCCPLWCRWIMCLLSLVLLAVVIVVIVLVAMFKSPHVDFTGIQGTPLFNTSGTVLNLNLNLGFTVNNPNIESVTFTTLDARAYYHGYNGTSVGSGTLNDLHISSNAHTNIQFPFLVSIDSANSDSKAIAVQLLKDCGVGGGTQSKINLDYQVVATVKLFSFNIHIPYSSAVNFDCPMSSAKQQEILNTIGKTLLGSLPSAIPGLTNSTNGVLTSLPVK